MSYEVLLTAEFHGAMDVWTEHLCVEVLPDRRVELSSRSAEPLMGDGWEAGEVVWPDDYDPDDDEAGDDVLPVSVGGKRVAGKDGDFIVGEELMPHSDDAVAIFDRGQVEEAREWLKAYGWADRPGFPKAWAAIQNFLR